MTIELHVSAEGDASSADQAIRRFAAHLRKTPGLGLSAITYNGEDLLAGRGTADDPVKSTRTLPEGWTEDPDGGYLDADGQHVPAISTAAPNGGSA